MSEVTPLLSGSEVFVRPKDVYDRFSRVQKRVILVVISLAGLIATFASGCFIPCVPQVSKDLNTTGTVINYTVGIYIFTMAVGSLVWAPYAGFYGRQPIYLTAMSLLCLGSLSVSLSTNVLQLVVSRTVQAFGASCILSVGAATISDIYRLEERGTAMGIFFGCILLGPTLAPLVGGIAATYASWRIMQLILFIMAFTSLISIAGFLPETSHPESRGVDKLLALEPMAPCHPNSKRPTWKWVWLNPFRALALLRGPNILFVALAGAFTLVTDFVLLVPMSYTLGPRYGITTPALIGACFLPAGVGNIIGSPLAGRLSDRIIIKRRERRGGKWVPEDRLMATIPGALLLVPLSVLIFGMTTQFVSGKLGLVINLVCLFFNGVGINMVLSPCATYNVDIVHTRSAEVMATNSAFRRVICAIASAGVLPMIDRFGIAATNGIVAGVAWLAFGLLWMTIRYGDRMRA